MRDEFAVAFGGLQLRIDVVRGALSVAGMRMRMRMRMLEVAGA